ncbi:hypothetical protein ACRYGZ_00890 [Mycobacteroides abscessus]
MSPSSAIQRRCQAPHPNSTVTVRTLTHTVKRVSPLLGPTAVAAQEK